MKRALVLVLVAACGGSDPAGDDDAPIDAPVVVDAPFDPSIVETRQVEIGPVNAAPGEEETVCTVVDLGNADPRMIRRVRSLLTPGTHHVIATLSTAAPTNVLAPCGPFAGGGADNGVLTIAQQSESFLAYPDGAGLPVAAHQSIHLEMHYINTTDAALAIGGTVFLDMAADGGGLRPVEFLFTGNPNPTIPAGGMITATSFHTLQAGHELFATTAHTHHWGRRATVELLDDAGAVSGQLLHDSTNWAERPLDTFTPIVIREGQGLRLTCNFHNESDQDVSFGLSANDEMCFVWAHLVAPAP